MLKSYQSGHMLTENQKEYFNLISAQLTDFWLGW
jgi:hypothetical protein